MTYWMMFLVIALLFLARSTGIGAMTLFAGVCDSRNGDNLPSANQTVALYQKMNIGWIRLYKPHPDLLKSLQGTNILVAMGPKNEEIKTLAEQYKSAVSWIKTYIVPYNVAFNWIIVGNDVFPGENGRYVLQAMNNIKRALNETEISRNIHITTVLGPPALTNPYVPSAATFKPELTDLLSDIFDFLDSTDSPLMVKIYPYLGYVSDPRHILLEYATFGSTLPVVRDGKYQYTNLFDAMVDVFNKELNRFGNERVKVYVAETGWPTRGNPPYTSVENARAYNQGLLKKLTTTIAATPVRPDVPVVTFLFNMFNENLKQGEVEKSFGFFTPDLVPVYDMWNISVSSQANPRSYGNR